MGQHVNTVLDVPLPMKMKQLKWFLRLINIKDSLQDNTEKLSISGAMAVAFSTIKSARAAAILLVHPWQGAVESVAVDTYNNKHGVLFYSIHRPSLV